MATGKHEEVDRSGKLTKSVTKIKVDRGVECQIVRKEQCTTLKSM